MPSDPTDDGAPETPVVVVAPDPDLLARWLAVAQLLASAAELQARGGGAWPGLALVIADTADESVLGLIAAAGDDPPPEKANFVEIYKLANEELARRGHPLPDSLKTRILQVHRARNSAVHLAVDPPATSVTTALRTATELRAHAVTALEVLAAFGRSSPVRAVAELVDIPDVSDPLADSDRLMGEGKPAEAADQAAVALHAALSRVTPGLRTWGRRKANLRGIFGGMRSDYPKAEQELERAFEAADERSDRLEAWIVASGLGLRPAELARLQALLGEPMYTLGGPQPSRVIRHPDVKLTEPAVGAALLLVADIVYRLWQNDSLRVREPWES